MRSYALESDVQPLEKRVRLLCEAQRSLRNSICNIHVREPDVLATWNANEELEKTHPKYFGA